MDRSDQDNTFLVEQTTTLVYESAVIARRKRTEIRRFKKISSLPVPARSLNSVHQGVFKRSRPLRTSSICSMCYLGNDGDDDCDSFPMSKLSPEQSTKLLAEIEVPHAYTGSERDVLRGGGLVRSKSFPLECVHTSRCILHITKASHDHVAMNVEGHFMTVVSDEHGSTVKEVLSESCSWNAEVTSSVDPNKSTSLLGGMTTSSVKESLPVAAQQAGESVLGLNSGEIDVEGTKGELESSKEVRFSADESSELDVHMPDPGDSSNIIPGDTEVLAPPSSSDPQNLGRCPLSGKVLVCGRRREMEDTAIIVPSFMRIPCSDSNTPNEFSDLHFFAVYDGHGGAQASNFCAGRFHHALAEELASSLLIEGVEDDAEWKKVMASCFLKVDQEVGGVCPNGTCDEAADNSVTCCVGAVAPENVGTTAVVAIFSPSKIVIANCGDSRAVLSRGGVAIPLTKDHKPERDDETSRIEAAGGRVIYWDGYRVSGILALSRALGDRYLKQYVISEPDVLCLPRTDDDECLILASDGLWDVISNETACDVARRCLASARKRSEHRRLQAGEDTASAAVAALLVKLAYGRGSKDNISVIVIDLKSRHM